MASPFRVRQPSNRVKSRFGGKDTSGHGPRETHGSRPAAPHRPGARETVINLWLALSVVWLWLAALKGNWLTLAAPLGVWVFVMALTRGTVCERASGRKKEQSTPETHSSTFSGIVDLPLLGAVLLSACAIAFNLSRPTTATILDADIEVALTEATILFEQGQYRDALNAFDAISIPPYLEKRRAQKYHDIGAVLLRLGRTDEAVEALRQAIRYDPGDTAARYMLERLENADE